jgi:anti-sigma B factor antagonist
VAEGLSRRDELARKLLLAAEFCAPDQVEDAVRALSQTGFRLSVLHVLLRRKAITPLEYRMLNMMVGYELRREEDVAFGKFLVGKRLVAEERVAKLLAAQEPYYREGKEFPRLALLLEREKDLTAEKIRQAWVQFAPPPPKSAAPAVPPPRPAAPAAPPPAPSRPELADSESVDLAPCRVVLKTAPARGAGGKPIKVYVVSLGGQLDASNSRRFDLWLQRQLERERPRLVLELSRLQYVNSSGIGILSSSAQAARQEGGDVRLAAVPEKIMSVLSMVGLPQHIKVFASEEAAVASYDGT